MKIYSGFLWYSQSYMQISKYCLPGYILPYFPDKATQTQGIKKVSLT